jgi:RNA polymerase sigma factor (sigma-70 family)
MTCGKPSLLHERHWRSREAGAPFGDDPGIVGIAMQEPAPTTRPRRPVHGTSDLPRLAEHQRPALWRYARMLGADAQTADDLVQQSFLVVLQRDEFCADQPGAVFTFLRTTCRHLWLRSQRRRVAEREVGEADALWVQHCGDGPGEEYTDALRACIDRLPTRSQALLAATYGRGAGRDQAGAQLGLSRDGVKSALRRLRTFLHDCIRRRMEVLR